MKPLSRKQCGTKREMGPVLVLSTSNPCVFSAQLWVNREEHIDSDARKPETLNIASG